LDQGLLTEVDSPGRPAARGRPPVALQVRPEAGLVAGIKLSDEVHTGVVIDFAGNLLAESRLPRSSRRKDLGAVLDDAATLFERLCGEAGLPPGAISGLGIGIPGAVEHETGRVIWSPILPGRDVDLRRLVSARLGLEVAIDNDANLVTLAELWYGAGRALTDFAVVTIEHGVGMGLVVGNRLYRGSRGLGTELGHTKVQLDGALCRCGQRGCLEAYVADYALVREAAIALDLPPWRGETAQVVLENLFEQAKAGNEAARSIFRRAGRYLALGLSNVALLFDPSLIILSGERMQFDYLYADDVLAEMRRLAGATADTPVRVEINTWGASVWARGAATLALSDLTARLTAQAAA
jgi:predicted NBD/HSP70 family sugar kinase